MKFWLGTCKTAATADTIVTMMHVPTSEWPWRVQILKSRRQQDSVHAFKTYTEALFCLTDNMTVGV